MQCRLEQPELHEFHENCRAHRQRHISSSLNAILRNEYDENMQKLSKTYIPTKELKKRTVIDKKGGNANEMRNKKGNTTIQHLFKIIVIPEDLIGNPGFECMDP